MQNGNDRGLVTDQGEGGSAREVLLNLLLAADSTAERRNTIAPRGTWDAPLPVSCAQERLWLLNRIGLVGAAYNISMALRLSGELVDVALERSFTELVSRHEILRTHIEAGDGTPHQVIDAAAPISLEKVDLSGMKECERELRARMQREQIHRFDLQRGPLFRAVLVRLSSREHVLLLTLHHIVADGWSLEIFMRELSALYTAYLYGRPSELPEPAVQYADYAIWQRQLLRSDALQEHLSYWRQQLAGAPPQLQLPTDYARPPVESFRGATLKFGIAAATTQGLRDLARTEGCTLFMLLLAAYQVLLSRWSAQHDVVVGSPIAGRTTTELEKLIGCFVNTLVLRAELPEQITFRQLLARVRETTLDAYAHQDVPFEMIVKELRPERSLARQPVFQVTLALQNYPEEQLDLSGLTGVWLDSEGTTSHFDLTLHFYERASGLLGALEYSTDLFREATARRMVGHMQTLLEGIIRNPDSAISHLPLLTEAERFQQLEEWNATGVTYPHDKAVHELFQEQARRAPHAVAVKDERRAFTYSELNLRANRLARYLRDEGLLPGEYVPILMPRGLQMLVSQIAVLKCGGAYVPLDPDLPIERLRFVIGDCGARLVLTERPLDTELEQDSVGWRDCSEAAVALDKYLEADLDLAVDATAPAYVMYTSGSTGVPKGVVVPHRAVNRLAVNNSYARIEASDCIAHCSNPAFDASTFEIWGALLNGASVLVVRQAVVLDPVQFADVLREQNVSVLWLTIGLLAQYTEALAPVFGQLKYLMTGGDVVEPRVLARILHGSTPRHLLCAYGPTECTTFATTYTVQPGDEAAPVVPIGRPIANTQVYVLDAHLQPVPIGACGEIYIGGPGLALGYLNRQQLTAERFIRSPFARDPQERLYRTGDLGRWRSDGNIEFLGRNDEQIKLRGFRIELGEIEAELLRHSAVKDAAVVARADSSGPKRLAAYVTLRGGGGCGVVSPDELRAHLRRMLPEYMIPTAFVVLKGLPLTSSGKVDKRSLPAPNPAAYAAGEFEPPQGDMENSLAALWQQLLRAEKIGRRDNFFELGGDSLDGVRLVTEISRQFMLAVSAIIVFQYPTIEQMARVLQELSDRGAGSGMLAAAQCDEGTI